MIELTVALPIYNSKKIAWLQLESLCRQDNIDFKWELIIIEEANEAFGELGIKPFIQRLQKAGCVSIKYCPLQYKISLSKKWKEIALLADDNSKTFVFCAADDYSEPTKLYTAHKAVKLGYDWVQYRYALMYDLVSKKHIKYDCNTIGRACGSIMACKTESARNLPELNLSKGVDSWLFKSINPEFIHTEKSDSWMGGFATDGMNNISLNRKLYYSKIEPPFEKTELHISNILTKENYTKLNSLL